MRTSQRQTKTLGKTRAGLDLHFRQATDIRDSDPAFSQWLDEVIGSEGTTKLKARMLAVAYGLEQGGFVLALDEVVEQAITDLDPTLAELPAANRRWLTIKLS